MERLHRGVPISALLLASVVALPAHAQSDEAKRFGAPLMLDATDATLTMDPPPAANIAGSAARMVRNIERTLRLNEKSQASSSQSRMVPWCTKPAPLNSTSMEPSCSPSAAMAVGSVTSTRRARTRGILPSSASEGSWMSSASTFAPSRA